MSCHGHKRVFDSTRLRFSGAGAKKSVGHNNGIPSCHQCGTSRVTSGGKGPCMMAAFTVSRHFMVTILLSEMGTAVPHARHRPHAGAGVLRLGGPTHSRVAHEFSTYAPTRMASAAASPLYYCPRSFSRHSWIQPPKNLDETTLIADHACSVDA